MTAAGGVRAQLEGFFRAGLAAVDAAQAVRRALEGGPDDLRIAGERLAPDARVHLLAVGKAAAAMAAAFESVAGPRVAAGLAVTAEGTAAPLERCALRETAHPIPDARCERAAREAQALVRGARPGDVLVVLLSGGASSLLSCPADGLTLDDLAATTRELLAAGADIEQLNAVRKHLSAVAGGRLALLAGCRRIEVLALSDVPGDRLDVIGSGPFCADSSRYADALGVLERCGIRGRIPARVVAHLEEGARGGLAETPKPGDRALSPVRTHLLATNATALEAARAAAERAGLRAIAAPGALHGEARAVGARLGALAAALRAPPPVCLVAGGETTVTVRGRGRGGRSQELALAAALAFAGAADAALLAAGTDGTDGPTDAAGAFADGATAERGRRRGRDPRAALDDNDSYGFFEAEGGLFRTGPTHTNVMDLALLRVGGPPR